MEKVTASAQMLIRRPVAEVFQAFVDPEITSMFWFTKSSGKLEPGARVKWEWEMYGVSADVHVTEIEPDRRILIEWPAEKGRTTVEWQFSARADGTFVKVINAGFSGSADEIVQQAIDSTGGFTIVLAGLKALLEHDIRLKLVEDQNPG